MWRNAVLADTPSANPLKIKGFRRFPLWRAGPSEVTVPLFCAPFQVARDGPDGGMARPPPSSPQKLLEGVPQMVVAENTLTSIQMIEPYYTHIRAEANFDRLTGGDALRWQQGQGDG